MAGPLKIYYANDLFGSSIEDNPSLLEIIESANRLHALIERVEDSEVPKILKGTIKLSENSFVATILGIEEGLVEYLEACDNYLSPEQWTMRFIDWKLDQLNEDDTLSIQKEFESLGFIPSKASALSDLVQNNPLSAHLTAHQWATRYIELQFKYNILLSGCRGFSSPDCVESRDTDIDVEYDIKTDVDDGDEPVNIKAINKLRLTTEELTRDRWFYEYLNQQEHPMEKVTYWFHGTDVDSAKNICTQGISVDQGRPKMDFSDGSGLYLTRYVIMLADKSYYNLTVVTIFLQFRNSGL